MAHALHQSAAPAWYDCYPRYLHYVCVLAWVFPWVSSVLDHGTLILSRRLRFVSYYFSLVFLGIYQVAFSKFSPWLRRLVAKVSVCTFFPPPATSLSIALLPSQAPAGPARWIVRFFVESVVCHVNRGVCVSHHPAVHLLSIPSAV